MLVVRGLEDWPTTAVAVRDAHFKGVKRRFFALQDAGDTKYRRGGRKQVFNRLMYCTLKCRSDYFEQPASDDTDEIGIAVAHMHCGRANQKNNRGGTTYKAFSDKLAQGIVEYKSRVFCIDANMALWCVVPELRARGVMVVTAAFYPFYQ